MSPIVTSRAVRDHVDALLPRVRAALQEHTERAAREIPRAGEDYAALWTTLGRQFDGGKNVRPALTLAAYCGLGGTDAEAVVPVAAAMEMLHTAMLVHDDILDHDEIRRGRPNVAGERRAALAGGSLDKDRVDDHVLTAALLGGDLALSSSYDLISRSTLPAHHRIACLDLVTRAIRSTIAGELLDMYGDLTPIEDSDALLVAELKTANYSCVVPLLAGAQLAGGDPTMVGHLESLGGSLGLSFQLIDDDLGVFGDPAVTGKSNLSDLRAGKRTELMRLGLERATPEGRERLRALVGKADLNQEEAQEVRDILESSGARAAAKDIASRHARRARRIARERIPAPLSTFLADLIDELETRQA